MGEQSQKHHARLESGKRSPWRERGADDVRRANTRHDWSSVPEPKAKLQCATSMWGCSG